MKYAVCQANPMEVAVILTNGCVVDIDRVWVIRTRAFFIFAIFRRGFHWCRQQRNGGPDFLNIIGLPSKVISALSPLIYDGFCPLCVFIFEVMKNRLLDES